MTTGIATFLGESIDSALATFVTQVSSQIAVGITPLVATGMSIWILTYGYAVMRSEVQEPISGFVKQVTKVSIILTIALTAGAYQNFVVDGVQAFQNGFVSAIAPNAAGNIYAVLDEFEIKSMELGLVIVGHGMTLMPMGGWMDLIAGLLVLCSTQVMMFMCVGFLLMAKVAMAMLLGLGPAFIASLAFPPIAKFFEAWFGKIMNYALLSVLLTAAVTICVKVIGAYIDNFAANQGKTNEIADAFGLVTVQGALLILIYQIPHIASGLGGGASISGGNFGAFVAGKLMNRSKSKSSNQDNGNDGGGSVSNVGGGSETASSKVPAYRRATLDRL